MLKNGNGMPGEAIAAEVERRRVQTRSTLHENASILLEEDTQSPAARASSLGSGKPLRDTRASIMGRVVTSEGYDVTSWDRNIIARGLNTATRGWSVIPRSHTWYFGWYRNGCMIRCMLKDDRVEGGFW